MARIEEALGPQGRDIDIVDPRTGAINRQRVTFDAILAAIQPIIYTPELSALLPELLTMAANGNFSPLVASALALTDNLGEQMNAALHYSVTCAEDVPRVTSDREARELTGLPVRGIALNVLKVCDVWPRGAMPTDFTQPVQSDKPALLFSGGLDPVTPPAYADLVAKTLSNSKHIVAPGYGHIVSPAACGPRLMASFIDRAGFDQLAPSCIRYFEQSTRPPIWAGRLEP